MNSNEFYYPNLTVPNKHPNNQIFVAALIPGHEIRGKKCSDTCQHKIKCVLTLQYRKWGKFHVRQHYQKSSGKVSHWTKLSIVK